MIKKQTVVICGDGGVDVEGLQCTVTGSKRQRLLTVRVIPILPILLLLLRLGVSIFRVIVLFLRQVETTL